MVNYPWRATALGVKKHGTFNGDPLRRPVHLRLANVVYCSERHTSLQLGRGRVGCDLQEDGGQTGTTSHPARRSTNLLRLKPESLIHAAAKGVLTRTGAQRGC